MLQEKDSRCARIEKGIKPRVKSTEKKPRVHDVTLKLTKAKGVRAREG
jgi:hypothetical protein